MKYGTSGFCKVKDFLQIPINIYVVPTNMIPDVKRLGFKHWLHSSVSIDKAVSLCISCIY